jgi:2-iminobutanoate/2-iminopropanoate deaminase
MNIEGVEIIGGRPDQPLPFSPAVRVGQWLFVSGQASTDEHGQIVVGSFAEEFQRSMGNLSQVLTAANASLESVVQVRAYVGRKEDLAEYNRLYREWFKAPYPARTTLIGCLSDVLKFEIDAMAFVSK